MLRSEEKIVLDAIHTPKGDENINCLFLEFMQL